MVKRFRGSLLVQMWVCYVFAVLEGSFCLGQESCTVITNSSSGFISSPNYPGNYLNNLHCTWNILAPMGWYIEVVVVHLDIQEEENGVCHDYLRILDSTIDDEANNLYYKCGSTRVQDVIISSHNVLTIVFSSDEDISFTGFAVEYKHVSTRREEFLLVADNVNKGIIFDNLVSEADERIIINSRVVTQIDYNPIDRKIYFTDTADNVIGRIGLNSSETEESLFEASNPTGLAINYVYQVLYWADDKGVFASSTDLSHKLWIHDSGTKTTDIAVHQSTRYVFWIGGNDIATILRSDGDGRNIRDVITGDILDPTGITLSDEESISYLYWCDNLHGSIWRADINGDNRTLIKPAGIDSPFDITLDWRGNLYWTGKLGNLNVLNNELGFYDEIVISRNKSDALRGIVSFSSEHFDDTRSPYCIIERRNTICEGLCLPTSNIDSSCVTVLPQILNCPRNIYTRNYSKEVPVFWESPTAVSQPYDIPVFFETNALPGSYFERGYTHYVMYKFTDDFGNVDWCNFTVTVSDGNKQHGSPVMLTMVIFAVLQYAY